MPISVQCRCGKRLTTSEKNAGRRAACPSCGAEVVFPAAAAPAFPFDLEFEGIAPEKGHDVAPSPAAEAPPGFAVDIGGPAISGPPPATARVTPKSPAREPWFFRFLTSYASLCIGFGLLQFVVVAVFGLVAAMNSEGGGASFGVLGVIMAYSLGVLLVTLLFTAPIFLAVDMARSLRRIEANTARFLEGRGT